MLQKHLQGGPVNGIASQHLHPCGYQEGLPRELVTVRIASHRSSSSSYYYYSYLLQVARLPRLRQKER